MNEQLLLTVNDAAARLGVGRSFVYELVMRGELASLKLGRRRLVPVAALEAFVAQQMQAAAEARE